MKIFIYSGTHWDREWYQTFQGFRKRLVDMVDDLIEGLEAQKDYGVFHFDGQTIVLEDYLEIRPEMSDRLAALIKQGKILIGPWYDMPDEFLCSGESLIKNLRRGHEICKKYGVKSNENGYVCDIFGHSSQTPQIFKGFNLNHSVLGRGLSDLDAPGNFRWQSPDGSEVITYHLPDENGYTDFGVFANEHPLTMPKEELHKAIREYFLNEAERCAVPVIVAFDSIDHCRMRHDTGAYIEEIKAALPEAEVYHLPLEEYGKEIDKYRDELPVLVGELANTARICAPYIHVITDTTSSRYPLKAYNDKNQTMLEKWIAPLYASKQTKLAYGFYDQAVKYLLKNHPHDSICGCSIDQVHRDMIFRFDQTRLLCDEIRRPFIYGLSNDLSKDAIKISDTVEGKRLRIYNPLPYALHKTVTAKVDLDDIGRFSEPFGYEGIPNFRLYDVNGKEIEYGYVDRLPGDCYVITFECDLTAAGVTEFAVVPQNKPTRYPARMPQTPTSVEADNISLSVNPDGSVNLTDKASGQTYEKLLTFIDDGEIGDGWYHCNPLIDESVSPTRADVKIIENNSVRITFRVTQHMPLPLKMINRNGYRRSEETVDFKIVNTITVAKSDRGIDILTEIDNNAMDHRLRMRMPSAVLGESYEASQAFSYITRKCGDKPETSDWGEYDWGYRNFNGICAKRNAERGLAFISAYGLHECAVWPNGDMDVIFFRCMDRTVGTSGEPDGELQQKMEFRYRIEPFGMNDRFSDLQKTQDYISAGTVSVVSAPSKIAMYRPTFFVEGENIVYSTAELDSEMKPVIRVFNDGFNPSTAKITLPAGSTKAELTELDGRSIRSLNVSDEKVEFVLPAFRIATVRFE